jgi:hypothetical protein
MASLRNLMLAAGCILALAACTNPDGSHATSANARAGLATAKPPAGGGGEGGGGGGGY